MSYAGQPLREAIFSTLTTALGTGTTVYFSAAPEKASFPYVVFDLRSTPFETKDRDGQSFILNLDTWNKDVSSATTVEDIVAIIHNELRHREEIAVVGHMIANIIMQSSEVRAETAIDNAGDHYYHGIQQFKIDIQDS